MDKSRNQYELKLTEVDALKLGISKKQFQRMLKDVSNTNAYIGRLLFSSRSGERITLFDPTQINIDSLALMKYELQTRSEEGGGGNITITSIRTTGSEWGRRSASIPFGANSISVNFWCGGLIDAVSYSVTVGGSTSSGNGVSALGWVIARDALTLAYTNTTGTFQFMTTNSNGGSCSFMY